MDIRPEFLGLVLACALVTAVPRVLPLRRAVAVPACRAGCSTGCATCRSRSWPRCFPWRCRSAAAPLAGCSAIAAALAVAALTRSLLGTVLAGVAVYWLLL